MKNHSFVPSTLQVKCSASLQAQIEEELKLEDINTKNIASLLKDEEKNNIEQEKNHEEKGV
jgi:hypothetical protein